MVLKDTGMVGVCDHCGLKIPIYDTQIQLVMGNHGIFEVGPGEENVTCPGSFTTEFNPSPNLGIKEE